ncbi:MAG: hypothetical protein FH751_14350 [Firmicutes bacterium]|nr:hypothetical protein [Bacillota bacterium]
MYGRDRPKVATVIEINDINARHTFETSDDILVVLENTIKMKVEAETKDKVNSTTVLDMVVDYNLDVKLMGMIIKLLNEIK